MKNKLLAILAFIVFSIALLTPELLISLNNFVLGKLFLIFIIVLFTDYNIVAGCAAAILLIYINNLTYEGMQNIEKNVLEQISNLSDKKIGNIIKYDIAGSNTPSSLDKADLSKQMRPVESKTLPTFTIKDNSEPSPTNPALETFKVIGDI
uniref:Uncharacterized protein n=1 Tax=viral metagenome TaxID=1070528 RepID=A0A6C0BT79_9ZZZZ